MNKTSSVTSSPGSFQKNICRTCLCKITALNSTPIFSDEDFLNGQSLKQVFVEITCTLIDPLEKLPSSMCQECVEKLKSAVNFKRSIEEADKKLRSKLRLAELSFYMGRTDSVDSMLDSFCDEIYSTIDKNQVQNATQRCENENNQNQVDNNTPVVITPNRNSIKIINRTNKDNAALTKNINILKKSSHLKTFSGKDFIEDFLHQQDTRHEPIADLSFELSNCQKVYSNKNKTTSRTSEEEEQGQYILIVQEVPDLIQDEFVTIAPQFIKQEIVEDQLPEVIEVPDSPKPSVPQTESDTTSDNISVNQEFQFSSDDKLAAEMAWIQDNLEDLGTLTGDNTIRCNKCEKRFTISKENNQQSAEDSLELKYNKATKTYSISLGREIDSTRKEPPPAACLCKTEHLNSTVEIRNREGISSAKQETVMSRKRSHPSDADSDIPISKPGRTAWTRDDMVAAVTAYKEEKLMGYKQCSRKFGIPMSTLVRYIKRSSTKEMLSSGLEAEIIQYGMEIKKLFYEITRRDLCKIVYDFCKMYNIENKFISQENLTDSAWLDSFLSRNSFIVQHLSKEKKNSSLPCASYESKLVEEFLNTYRTNLDKINLNPNRIYSCYEIGFAISKQKKKKVILVKGKQQIINLLPNEKSTLITSLICFNANGDFILPSVICSNQRMEPGLKTILVAGSLLTTHSFGWIPQKIFLQWLKHFINHVKPSVNDPVILLINGTEYYVKNIEVIKFAKDNNILLTILPPYQQGSLEPAEKGFVYRFKTLYKQKIKTWSEMYGRSKISYLGKLFGLTYLDSATSTIGKCGFAATNLFPLCEQTILLHKSTYSEEKEDSENEDDDCEQNETNEENKFTSCWVNEEVPTEMDGLEHSNNQSDPLSVGIKEEIDAKDEIKTYEETKWDCIKIKGEVLSE